MSDIIEAQQMQHKRPFAPSLSTAEVFEAAKDAASQGAFVRTDSRGSYQMAAAPPDEVLARLQSVAMRTRMAVERGFDPSGSSTTASYLPGRTAWSRTQSAPNHFQNRELQPFAATSASTTNAYNGFLGGAALMEQDEGGSFDGRSINSGTSSMKKRTAEDVLGDAFDDEDDGSQVGSMMETETENLDSNVTEQPRVHRPIPSSRPFTSRRPFAHTHTMPANPATSQYLASANAAESWSSIPFDDFAKRDDF